MKTLILVRHAKSDWNGEGLADFDRPLNERGKRDAPVMAARLLEKEIPVDLFIASPAKRAAKTARIFAEAFGKSKSDIQFRDELYLPPASVFYKVIEQVDDSIDHIALFSHNNGITDFANELCNTRIDNIPTCGIFAIKINCVHWKDFRAAKKEFWFFDSPKSTHV